MRASEVGASHELTPLKGVVKGTLAGKMLLAAYRQRHAPARVARARLAARRDRGPALPPVTGNERYRAVVVIPAGPGEWPALADTIESILAFEGDRAKIVVADDMTLDCRQAAVRARFPQVDVVRSDWPAGGPTRLYPLIANACQAALRRYEFDVLVKLDADALLTGPGLSDAAAEVFAAHPDLGVLGTCGLRADGVPEDHTYDAWVIAHSRRWSRSVRRLVERAQAGRFTGAKVHGGVYLVSRRALDRAKVDGLLDWRPPWWSMLGEDACISLVVCAAGFGVGSFGAPGEPTASANGFLPLDKHEVLRQGKLAIHSVRRGLQGESENELRAFFRRARGGNP